MKTKTFQVVGDHTMHCGGCEGSVNFVLSVLPGVREVRASHKTQRIDVAYDETQPLDPAQVQAELDNLGYRVEELQE